MHPMDRAVPTVISRDQKKKLYSEDGKGRLQVLYVDLDTSKNYSIQTP